MNVKSQVVSLAEETFYQFQVIAYTLDQPALYSNVVVQNTANTGLHKYVDSLMFPQLCHRFRLIDI